MSKLDKLLAAVLQRNAACELQWEKAEGTPDPKLWTPDPHSTWFLVPRVGPEV